MANPILTGPGGETLTSPDLWFDDVGLAVMVQSRRFHADGLDWEATVEQGSDLSTMRVVVVGVTPTALARDPEAQLRRIERAHEAAARTGVRAPGHRSASAATVPLGADGLSQTREMVRADHRGIWWGDHHTGCSTIGQVIDPGTTRSARVRRGQAPV